MRSRVLSLLFFVACAKPAAVSVAPAVVAPPAPVGGPWVQELRADHPLVGLIWRTSDSTFVSEDALVDALRAADWRLLGEKHDNADHHRLQARLITQLAPEAVAFEQLDDGDPVDGAATPDALAEAVGWDESGWPDFPLYAPVFEAVFAVPARVLPAHPTREQLMGSARGGLGALGEAAAGLPLDRALDEAQTRDLTEEIVASHCGHADERMVSMMIGMQRLKDAWMARALTRHGPGAVLVAGNGHTRADRGVPHYLDGASVTLAFREVEADTTDPRAYDEPAEFVWFTPRVDEADPCEQFREALEGMSGAAGEPAPGEP